MRLSAVVRAVLFATAVWWAPASAAQRGEVATTGAPDSAFVGKYCVTCHSEHLKTGGLVLEHVDLAQRSPEVAALREKVIRKIRVGAMPPARAPRPDHATLIGFVSQLETMNDREAKLAPNAGRPVLHRLNRVEYTNAIRDLLGLEIDGRALLPPDDSSYGFDNVADVLSISPSLLDRYLLAAGRISRVAVGDTTLRPDTDTYPQSATLLQDDRMGEDLPFGTQGGLSVRHEFPVDGDYEFRVRFHRSSINVAYTIRGLDHNALVDIRLDGVKVRQAVVKGSDLPKDGPGIERPLERKYNEALESSLRVRVPVTAGSHQLTVTFARNYWYMEGIGVGRLPLASEGYNAGEISIPSNGKIDLEVESLDVFGPLNAVAGETTSHSRVFSCRPRASVGEDGCARAILSRLARLAYRRPVTPDDLTVLMASYGDGRRDGSFEQGIQAGLERILVSPYFLFRKEDDPPNARPGSTVRVSDIDLASRMSFFLWSSIPDEELLNAAASSRLRNPQVLQQQIVRMLRDDRSKALLSNFFGQWLYLRNLASHAPDPKLFPKFDDSLRDAFSQETARFLESQVREDHDVLDLFTANYTFVNERLARYYGIPNIYGSHFRRVTLPADGPRAGVLGQGSLLTVTSYADRTSPVLRGKWLLENVLGNPPPPPPPDVPPFPDNSTKDAPRSVRARMEMHRRNPVCATCHSQIDPLGFALENFDAAGLYRTTDNGTVVDPSGSLPDGSTFKAPSEFRQLLVSKRDQLMTTLTEKLLTYALGRGVEYYDQPAIRRIIREAGASGDRWSVLITNIVKSGPFQMRRSAS